MIKNVVFDIGSVLLNFKPVEFLKSKYSNKKIVDDLYGLIFCGQEWIEMDRGTLTEKEAVKVLSDKMPEYSEQIAYVMKNWHEMHTPVKGTSLLLKKFKDEGYKIYLLTNYHEEAFQYIENKYDFIRNVDGKIVSARVKLLKPDYDIYKALIDRYNISPKESVFIDDHLENVQAAKDLDFSGIQFKDAEDLEAEFSKLTRM